MPHIITAPTLILTMILSLAGPAAATQEYTLPTLFDVARVADDDVLNIRDQPDAASEIVGELAPDATRIEVVEERNGWSRINTGERSGWVSSRYLDYRVDVWNPDTLPEGFHCFGTEPFWSIAPRDRESGGQDMILATPDGADDARPLQAVLSTPLFRDPTRVVLADGLTLTAVPQQCSDGMSDRMFGLRAHAVLHGEAPRLLSGCCAIQP